MNLDEFTFLANTFKFVVPITAVIKTVKGKLAVLHFLWGPINVTLLRDTGRERVRRGNQSHSFHDNCSIQFLK